MDNKKQALTYDDLISLFRRRNADIANMVNDYRPYKGEYALQVWLNDFGHLIDGQTGEKIPCAGEPHLTFYVRWIPEIEQFVFGKVDEE